MTILWFSRVNILNSRVFKQITFMGVRGYIEILKSLELKNIYLPI